MTAASSPSPNDTTVVNTSTAARTLARGSLLRFLNLVATALVSVLIMPFVVRVLGDRLYGLWTVVAALIGFYGVLDLGLSRATTRYLAGALGSGDEDECNRVFNTGLRLYLMLGALVLVAAILGAWLAHLLASNQQDSALFSKLIFILGLNLALQFPLRIFTGALEAQLRFDRIASLDLCCLALRTMLTVLALKAGYQIEALAWVTLLSNVPSMALTPYFARREMPFLRFQASYWKAQTARALFNYSLYGFVFQLANILRFQMDSWVVAGVVGLGAVTHYSVGDKLARTYMDTVLTLLGVFGTVFSRLEGAQNMVQLRRTFLFATRLSICVSSFIGCALLAWGRAFVMRWMGAGYLDGYACLVALVPGLMVTTWQAPSIALVYGISKHRFLAFSTVIEGGVNLALSILLAHRYGIVGVALGTTIPMLIARILVQPLYVCHVAKIALSEYVRRVARTLASVAVALIIPGLLTVRFIAPDYTVLLLLAGASVIAYGAVLWIVEFDSDETSLLRRAIWPRLAAKDAEP